MGVYESFEGGVLGVWDGFCYIWEDDGGVCGAARNVGGPELDLDWGVWVDVGLVGTLVVPDGGW